MTIRALLMNCSTVTCAANTVSSVKKMVRLISIIPYNQLKDRSGFIIQFYINYYSVTTVTFLIKYTVARVRNVRLMVRDIKKFQTQKQDKRL